MSAPTYEELLDRNNQLTCLIESMTDQLEGSKLDLEQAAWIYGVRVMQAITGASEETTKRCLAMNPYTKLRKERGL
jgi:hypothetical protein